MFIFVRQDCKRDPRRMIMSEDEGESPAKLQKLTDEPNEDQNNHSSLHEQTSSIFMLNVDCFEEIFDYISLPDLWSFGQTCKEMQRIAGEYFKRNYSSERQLTRDNGVLVDCYYSDERYDYKIIAPTFNPFITCILHCLKRIQPFSYIDAHSDEFSSLIEIHFKSTKLIESDIKCLLKVLPQIVVLSLTRCTVDGNDLYDSLLRQCKNLKVFHMYNSHSKRNILGNQWLLHEYPSLETFTFFPMDSLHPKTTELCEFFAKNPNVRNFSTFSRCLLRNAKELIESNTKLENLKVECYTHMGITFDTEANIMLLKKLYENGFYKRLHIKFITSPTQKFCEQIVSLHGLESLNYKISEGDRDFSHLTSLQNITLMPENIHKKAIIMNLVNLRHITIPLATFEDIMLIISHSKKLREIEATIKAGEIINLAKLNEQRRKLAGACKVVIFVRDHVFLETKWTTKNGDMNLSLIEMKRMHSQRPFIKHFLKESSQ